MEAIQDKLKLLINSFTSTLESTKNDNDAKKKNKTMEFCFKTHLQNMHHAVNHGSINRMAVSLDFLVAKKMLATLNATATKKKV